MQPDFPAAHSMDTTWFAVDRCGHVAVFESGEDGAVPLQAPDAYQSLRAEWPFPGELDRALRERELQPGVHETKLSSYESKAMKDKLVIRPRQTSFARGLYLLGAGLRNDRSRIRRADLDGTDSSLLAEPLFGTTDGRDWVEGRLHPESWSWLHEAPHRCLGCVSWIPLDYDRREENCRVLRYECSEYGVRPYQKANNPWTPATLEELRALTGQPIPDAPKFEHFCFSEKKVIQPLQWMPSRTWGSKREWVDEEGRKQLPPGHDTDC